MKTLAQTTNKLASIGPAQLAQTVLRMACNLPGANAHLVSFRTRAALGKVQKMEQELEQARNELTEAALADVEDARQDWSDTAIIHAMAKK